MSEDDRYAELDIHDVPDDQLFDFDKSELLYWDQERAEALLAQYPELYRNHLAIDASS